MFTFLGCMRVCATYRNTWIVWSLYQCKLLQILRYQMVQTWSQDQNLQNPEGGGI